MLLIRALVILLSMSAISAQMEGTCPQAKVVKLLQVDKFLGLWYEVSRSIPNDYEPGAECVTFNYSRDEYRFIKIINRQFSNVTKMESESLGNATIDTDNCANNEKCGKLKVAYLKKDNTTIVGDLWIVALHYSSYAVLWSCHDDTDSNTYTRRAWVISRSPHPPDSLIEGAQKALYASNITDVQFENTKQHTFCGEYYRHLQE